MKKSVVAATLGAAALSLALGTTASYACEEHKGQEGADKAAAAPGDEKPDTKTAKKAAKKAPRKVDAARAAK